MTAFFQRLRLRIIDRFTTDTSELIEKLFKLEAKIEKAIEKDRRKGAMLVEQAALVNQALRNNDRNLNAAYKLLNNVSELTR